MKNLSPNDISLVLAKLEHALGHVKQGEAEHAVRPLFAAIRLIKEATLRDVVFASTCAEDDPTNAGSIVVGVTAHCTCGRSFCDDVRAGYPQRLKVTP